MTDYTSVLTEIANAVKILREHPTIGGLRL